MATSRWPSLYQNMWYLYLLKCRRGIYCGITDNPPRRWATHNSGKGAKAVVALGLPGVPIYCEACGEKSAALRREISMKRLNPAAKMAMVNSVENIYGTLVE